MKNYITTSALVFILFYTTYGQNEIMGTWMTSEGKTIVEIQESETENFEGKIAWLKHPTDKKGRPHTDSRNPDKSLRDRTILGLTMIESLVHKNGKWIGKIYSPKNGRTVDATFSVVDDNQLRVDVTFRGFHRTQTWYRSDVPQ